MNTAQLTEFQRQALEISEDIAEQTRKVNDAPAPLNFDADAFFAGAIKQGMQQLGVLVEEFEAADGCTSLQFTFHDGSAIHTYHRQCYAGEYHIHLGIHVAEAIVNDVCWRAVQSTRGIGATATITQAPHQAHEEVLHRLQGRAMAITTNADGTVTFQFKGGALRGKGLYWRIENPAFNTHRERFAETVRDALRSAEETAPGDNQFAQSRVEFYLFEYGWNLSDTEGDKREYNIAFEDGISLIVSGYGNTWWFGRLFQAGHAEFISLEPERAVA